MVIQVPRLDKNTHQSLGLYSVEWIECRVEDSNADCESGHMCIICADVYY